MGSHHPTVGAALLLAVATVAMIGCGGGGDGTDRDTAAGADGRTVTVSIEDYLYEPARIVVPEGTTVAFANSDAAPHTATSEPSGAFDTETIRKGESATVKLEVSGSFAYYCLFHPFMKGTVLVE